MAKSGKKKASGASTSQKNASSSNQESNSQVKFTPFSSNPRRKLVVWWGGTISLLMALLAVFVQWKRTETKDDNSSSSSTLSFNNKNARKNHHDDGVAPRTKSLTLLDQLFPQHCLDRAWEVHPLLSTIYSDKVDTDTTATDTSPHHNNNGDDTTQESIPRVTVTAPLEQQARLEWAQDLFALSNVSSVLYPQHKTAPPLQHGSDYRIVQKVVRDGQEWSGTLPGTHVPLPLLQEYLGERGFSLIVNKMQRRWTAITQVARTLQRETTTHHVNANLYLTPVPVAASSDNNHAPQFQSGFETHWDGMDVIVVQLVGRKLWSVARQPHILCGVKDQKYKPTPDELESSYSAPFRYTDFWLQPGDVLYIPRGFMHNASTSSTTTQQKDEDEDEDEPPSLHLTFGLEHGCETTVEALLHHAVQVHAAAQGKWANQVALTAQDCTQGARDIYWRDVLHFGISEVARRNLTCSRDDHDATCFLRKAVPMSTTMEQLMAYAMSYPGQYDNNNKDTTTTSLLQYMLEQGLQVVMSHLDVELTAQFVHHLETGQGENIRMYCHPYISPMNTVPCPSALSKVDEEPLQEYLTELLTFCQSSGRRVTSQMKQVLREKAGHKRQEENDHLRATGQGVPSN